MNAEFQYDVFLSHNQADKPRVRRLAEWLPLQLGARNPELGIARPCLPPAALGSGGLGLTCAAGASASERGRRRSTVGRGNHGSGDLRVRDPASAGRRLHPRRALATCLRDCNCVHAEVRR